MTTPSSIGKGRFLFIFKPFKTWKIDSFYAIMEQGHKLNKILSILAILIGG